MGVDLDLICLLNQEQAFQKIKRRILDTEFQELLGDPKRTYFLLYLHVLINIGKRLPLPFKKTTKQKTQECRAYTLARCNTMPPAIMSGRLRGLPYIERHHQYGQGMETSHLLLHHMIT